MKEGSTKGLIGDNRVVIFFSVLLAALSWLAVKIIDKPDALKSVRSVPVNLTQHADALLDLGLNAIVDGESFVTVTVRGPSTTVGNLKPEDLGVTVRIAGIVNGPGTYDLDVALTSGTKESLGENVTLESIAPSTIQVRFDTLASRTYTVEPVVMGLTYPPEYVGDQERVTPSRVTISGPQADLDRVDRVVVTVDLTEPLTRTYSGERPIQLLDAEGNEIGAEGRHLVLGQTEAQLTVPVKKLKTLPLLVEITNEPTGFPLRELRDLMDLTVEAITVAGPVETTDNYQEIVLGHVDLRTITPDSTIFDFKVPMPNSNFTNVDNLDDIRVEFMIEDWSTARFRVELSTTTPPPQYDVALMASTLSDVVLVGREDVLETITSEDIVAMVDLADKVLQPGQYNYPVKISVPTKGLVWAAGEYSAIIQVSETTEPSE